jgi:hypothetical protein
MKSHRKMWDDNPLSVKKGMPPAFNAMPWSPKKERKAIRRELEAEMNIVTRRLSKDMDDLENHSRGKELEAAVKTAKEAAVQSWLNILENLKNKFNRLRGVKR